MPNDDPIAAQKAICEAVSRVLQVDALDARQLDVLLGLDRHARRIGKRLLRRYVEGNAQLQVFHRRDWSAALRLSQSFHEAYRHSWRQIRTRPATTGSRIRTAFCSSCFTIAKSSSCSGSFDTRSGFRPTGRRSTRSTSLRSNKASPDSTSTPSSSGQACEGNDARGAVHPHPVARPVEQRAVLAARGTVGRCSSQPLVPKLASSVVRRKRRNAGREKGFVVDLDGTEGLRRAVPSTADNALFLDTSPLMELIAEELEAQSEGDFRLGELEFATRAGKIAMLKKVAVIVDPTPVRIRRRGERTQIAVAVEGVAGFADIVQVLREEAGTVPVMTQVEGITISPFSAERYSSSFPADVGIDPGAAPDADGQVVVPQVWQVKDRSDSGRRMRGQIEDLNQLIPGALIATREGAHAPWTVSVVRRFQAPDGRFRRDRRGGPGPAAAIREACRRRDNRASCRRAWRRQPPMLRRTLPAAERRASENAHQDAPPSGALFQSRGHSDPFSANANYTLRLNQPIHQQFEFVCVPFAVLHKQPVAPE